MRISMKRMSRIFLLFGLACLAGCAATTRSEHYYLLSPLAETGAVKSQSGSGDIAVGIGPLQLPDYLDRPQLVTRTASSELHFSEFHRWAGSLRDDLGRVLAQDLATLLQGSRVELFPWPYPSQLDYLVELEFLRFEGSLGGEVELAVRWIVRQREGRQPAAAGTFRISEPVRGAGYPDLVAAQSRALAGLGRELAAVLKGQE